MSRLSIAQLTTSEHLCNTTTKYQQPQFNSLITSNYRCRIYPTSFDFQGDDLLWCIGDFAYLHPIVVAKVESAQVLLDVYVKAWNVKLKIPKTFTWGMTYHSFVL